MHWKKLEVLGVGSYGTVSLVTPEYSPSILLAVKSTEVACSSSLRVEGKILNVLRGSEYIVECFGEDESVENGERTYNLLLEYAPGGTLHDLIQNSKTTLGESEVAYYAFQILSGISHVHRKGFIHCDLKPENILVFPRGGADNNMVDLKLADFGLSLRSNNGGNEKRTFNNSKKHHYHRGTLLYGCPESVMCGIRGKTGDIWSLGCILVEMITGRLLWSGYANRDELEFKISHEQPKIPNNISKVAKHFLRKCLERDHDRRWTAEMLLNHPFIRSVKTKKVTDPFYHASRKTLWFSTKHLFSDNISSAETNNNASQCETNEGSQLGMCVKNLINLLHEFRDGVRSTVEVMRTRRLKLGGIYLNI